MAEALWDSNRQDNILLLKKQANCIHLLNILRIFCGGHDCAWFITHSILSRARFVEMWVLQIFTLPILSLINALLFGFETSVNRTLENVQCTSLSCNHPGYQHGELEVGEMIRQVSWLLYMKKRLTCPDILGNWVLLLSVLKYIFSKIKIRSHSLVLLYGKDCKPFITTFCLRKTQI